MFYINNLKQYYKRKRNIFYYLFKKSLISISKFTSNNVKKNLLLYISDNIIVTIMINILINELYLLLINQWYITKLYYVNNKINYLIKI